MVGSSTLGNKTVLHPVSDVASVEGVHAALLSVPPQTDESPCVLGLLQDR